MHSSLCDLEVNGGLHSFCICSRHLMLYSLICRLSLWPSLLLLSVITSFHHLHCHLPPSHQLLCCHVLFLQHFHVCYKQQRTLFTERVKRLLSNLFQSESRTFLLGSEALARRLSLIFFPFFLPSLGDHWRSSAELQTYSNIQPNLVFHLWPGLVSDLSAVSGDLKCFYLDFFIYFF